MMPPCARVCVLSLALLVACASPEAGEADVALLSDLAAVGDVTAPSVEGELRYAAVPEGPLAGARVLVPVGVEVRALNGAPPGPDFALHQTLGLLTAQGGEVVRASGDALTRSSEGPVGSFDLEPSGGLALISGAWLGVDAEGAFSKRVALPAAGLRVTTDAEGQAYVFGEVDGAGVVYHLSGGRYGKLLEVPGSILCARAASGGALFVGVKGGVYAFKQGEAARVVFADLDYEPRGLAYDSEAGVLYVSDGGSVLAVREGAGIPLLVGAGGALRWAGGGLHVLDPKRMALVSLSGLDWLGAP